MQSARKMLALISYTIIDQRLVCNTLIRYYTYIWCIFTIFMIVIVSIYYVGPLGFRSITLLIQHTHLYSTHVQSPFVNTSILCILL